MTHRLLRSFRFAALSALCAAAACTNSQAVTDDDLPPGTPAGGGIGAACSAAETCRRGLVCDPSGHCAAGHATLEGQPCAISDECASGLYCSAMHQCAKGGSGQSGDGCQSDADCSDGLRCTIVGLGAECAPEGTGDLGATCTTSGDCYGGLACTGGKCAQAAPGTPPFGLSTWPGTACESEGGAPAAWFHVPRGTDDGDFYRLPFPNDIRTKNGHPDLTGHPTPGSDLLGYDLVDRYLRAIEQENDGFGPYQTVYFRFDVGLDFASWQNAKDGVQIVDLTKGDPDYGRRLGLQWYASGGRTKYICQNWMGVRPANGAPYTPGHTYAILLSANGGTDDKGGKLAQGEDFPAMLASSAPGDATLAAAWKAYQPLRDYIASGAIDAASILNASVFTIGHPRRTAEKLEASLQAAAAPTASGWVKCGAGVTSPCSDATGPRACGGDDPAFDELQALVELPIFQQGTAPYLKPEDGGQIDSSGGTIPVVRTEKVCMSLTIPKGATMPANGWPVVVYAHGTGGHYRSAITEGVAGMLASADTGQGTAAIAVLGIDQVQHGPRRNGSTASPNDLFFNFANPHAARDNALQGAADQMSLARFAATLDLAAAESPTGSEIKLDPSAIGFWGHSQGATEGGIAVPYSKEIAGAVLSGEGASLMHALLSKTSPVNIAAAVPFALGDPDPNDPTKLAAGDMHPILSLLQSYIDPADPLNYAVLMAASPPSGTTGHHVFQPYGLGDTYAPPITEQTYALAAQLGLVAHDPSVTTPDDFGLTESAAPFGPNFGALTAAVREYAPSGYDGHFVATRNPVAKGDVARFLGLLALGKTPVVGP